MTQRTLSIIARCYCQVGFIIARFESKVCAFAHPQDSHVEAEQKDRRSAGRPFFGELTDFMSSGPCVVMVLEGKTPAAEPKSWAPPIQQAAEGTRKLYASSIGENAVHGSDAPGGH